MRSVDRKRKISNIITWAVCGATSLGFGSVSVFLMGLFVTKVKPKETCCAARAAQGRLGNMILDVWNTIETR